MKFKTMKDCPADPHRITRLEFPCHIHHHGWMHRCMRESDTVVWIWPPTSELFSLIKTHTEEKEDDHNPFCHKMCVFCFDVNARQPFGCTRCKHPHRLGFTFQNTCDIPALKLTKYVRRMGNPCGRTVKEIEINPTRLDR